MLLLVWLNRFKIRRIIAIKWAIPLLICRLFLYKKELTVPECMDLSLEQLQLEENQIILMRSSAVHMFGVSGKLFGISTIQEPSLIERVIPKTVKGK